MAHTEATNAGNKRSFSVAKIDDSISTRQKKQQDMGRYEGMIYSEKEAKMNKLTWLVLIFDDVKGVGRGRIARAWHCCAILIKKSWRRIICERTLAHKLAII